MELPNEVWVVEGATGEYSDHLEWPVCFYYSQSEAQAKVEFLSAMYRESKIMKGQDYDLEKEAQAEKFMQQYDPHFQTDCTGTNYHAYKVELGKAAALRTPTKVKGE